MSAPAVDYRELTEFVLARTAELEAVARDADRWPRWVMAHDMPNAFPGIAEHIIRHDPARVLARCESDRMLLGIAEQVGMVENGWSASIVRALAFAHRDHPDYKEAWS